MSEKPETNEAGRTCGLAVAPCSAAPWKVHVTVRGADAGDYEHATFEAARKMADERNAKFGVLGCHYRLIAPANECRCCGKPGAYVRTRWFATSSADVWECATEGCENRGMIWHTDSPNNKVTNAPTSEQ